MDPKSAAYIAKHAPLVPPISDEVARDIAEVIVEHDQRVAAEREAGAA